MSPDELSSYFAPLPKDIDLAELDLSRIPAHIAVIMDGNGRWAMQKGRNRAFGHKAGIVGVRELIRTTSDLGVRYLTIFSFSTENWSRPKTEVKTLMALFANTLSAELKGLDAEGVRIATIGDLGTIPAKTKEVFESAIAATAKNSGMTLIIAVNYGSQKEIVDACKRFAQQAIDGEISTDQIDALDRQAFAKLLETGEFPDPDLLIRTSGEYRLSNFLLYQIAYSELYITETLWPDFDKYELLRAVIAFQSRARRFGGV